jgi:hypothetical protein
VQEEALPEGNSAAPSQALQDLFFHCVLLARFPQFDGVGTRAPNGL